MFLFPRLFFDIPYANASTELSWQSQYEQDDT